MASSDEDVWDLFVASRNRDDIPLQVRRNLGGAAGQLFPQRYRRFMDAEYYAANRERRLAYQIQYNADHAAERAAQQMQRHRAHLDVYREERRRRYWVSRGFDTAPPREDAEQRSERARKAAARWSAIAAAKRSLPPDPIEVSLAREKANAKCRRYYAAHIVEQRERGRQAYRRRSQTSNVAHE